MFATFYTINDNNKYITIFGKHNLSSSRTLSWPLIAGKIYIYGFVTLFIYVVLSLFIAIIMDSYEVVKAGGWSMCEGVSRIVRYAIAGALRPDCAPGQNAARRVPHERRAAH